MNSNTQTINLTNDTYIVIDQAQGFVSINQGQQLGLDTDWGGQVVAFLTIEQAEAIASILYQPWSDPALKDVRAAEDRDDYVGM